MCDHCRARDAEPRRKAFLPGGLLEVLSTAEWTKLQAGQTGYVNCSATLDGPAASAKAAVMAITDPTVMQAKVRDVVICLN